jgi:hypothetical protein
LGVRGGQKRRDQLRQSGEEGDGLDRWGPCVDERGETRHQGRKHKPERKMYSPEYANGTRAEWAG